MNISKLTLGTVQFGMDYGVANTSGKPSYEDAKSIIACAYEGGVNCLDTAAAYGDSEDVLGRALSELGISDDMTVVTKIPRMQQGISPKEADLAVEKSVAESLKRLRLDVLPVCLLHVEEDAVFIESLLKVKAKGLVDRVGVSVLTPRATKKIIEMDVVDALQIPSNILDKRFTASGLISSAASKGLIVFIRSIYLQGLLLMPEESISGRPREVIPVRRQLRELAESSGMSMAELAIRYVLSLDGVTSALVGVDSTAQMRENLTLSNKGPLLDELVRTVERLVPEFDEDVIVLRNWKELRNKH